MIPEVFPVTPLLSGVLCIESSARILVGFREEEKCVDFSGGDSGIFN